MEQEAIKVQIELLKQQIALRESDYKQAIELHEDYNTLRHIRDDIRESKGTLQQLEEISQFSERREAI